MMTRRNIFTENRFSDHVKNAIEMIGNDLAVIQYFRPNTDEGEAECWTNVGQRQKMTIVVVEVLEFDIHFILSNSRLDLIGRILIDISERFGHVTVFDESR